MTDSLARTELVVRTIAQTAVDNETYFGELDSVVGDGDFGYSLARGFEKVLEGWDDIDRSDTGTFLKKTGMIISSRIAHGRCVDHAGQARRRDRGAARPTGRGADPRLLIPIRTAVIVGSSTGATTVSPSVDAPAIILGGQDHLHE